MKDLYLTGPITHNKQAKDQFGKVSEILRSAGYTVVNPLELNHPAEATWEIHMAIDIKAMMDVLLFDGELAMVDTHLPSKGMALEISIALSLGVPVRPWLDYLEEALRP